MLISPTYPYTFFMTTKIFFFFGPFKATLVAYGGSQAKG